ncbi:MAG TPA: hypothetical protein VJ455_05610 [Ignavibacteria bacterium]|nr:hypothetical protein [Ignavibacteria bacterium]
MKKLIIPGKDLGYYFLLIDMALIADNPEQLELEFENEITENSSEVDNDINTNY